MVKSLSQSISLAVTELERLYSKGLSCMVLELLLMNFCTI